MMIKIGYILLSLTMMAILLYGYNFVLTKTNVDAGLRKRKVTVAALALAVWVVYTFVLAGSGLLNNFDMPPRFPLLLVMPPFLWIAWIISRNRNSPLISAIPSAWLVYYQSFRIVIESLFVATVAIGMLHPEVTFQGYNYDILFGVSAPLVGLLAYSSKRISERAVLLWNYLGLGVIAVILFLFFTTAYTPSVWGSETTLAKEGMLTFPFVLVPAFLMPSAVFIHIVSIRHLKMKDL